MKRNIILISIIILLVCLLVACGSNSKLTGNWVCDEVHNGYPDQMIINSDGTSTIDGISSSWRVEGNQFIFVAGSYGSFTYEYEVSGKTLYLDDYSYHKQ